MLWQGGQAQLYEHTASAGQHLQSAVPGRGNGRDSL